jgi:hypothetical protein
MSTRPPLTDELLHEAFRVPAGTRPPTDIVDAIMGQVVATPPRRDRAWDRWSIGVPRARRVVAATVIVVVTAVAVAIVRPTATTRVGGPSRIGPAVVAPPTSRYGTATQDLLWLPGDQAIARVRRDSLTLLDTVSVPDRAGASAAAEAAVATDAGVWAVLPRESALVLLDTTTGAEIRRVGLDVAPYTLAVDGPDLWVASYDGDTVLRVDSATGTVLATITGIAGPTGIAVTDGGVWVAANTSSRIVRIDPETEAVAAQVMVAPGRPHSIVAGLGGVWTSNGTGTSVSRVDPVTTQLVATIPVPDIAWDVEIAGDGVWVTSGPTSGCQEGSEVAHIDPRTDMVTEALPFPCARALIADQASLWVNGEDERGTLLAPVTIGDGANR